MTTLLVKRFDAFPSEMRGFRRGREHWRDRLHASNLFCDALIEDRRVPSAHPRRIRGCCNRVMWEYRENPTSWKPDVVLCAFHARRVGADA